MVAAGVEVGEPDEFAVLDVVAVGVVGDALPAAVEVPVLIEPGYWYLLYRVPPVPVPDPAAMWLMTASAMTLTPAPWQALTIEANALRSPSRPAIL